MKTYILEDNWCIIEKGFSPELHQSSESLFSLGNGHMGQRANFEEKYSGKSLQGQYIAGVYYPDKTKVGWWKNGYPEYFAKVVNAPSWIGIHIKIDGQELDLHQIKAEAFSRVLNMKEGILYRTFIAILPGNKRVQIKIKRFLSIVERELGLIEYELIPLNFSGQVEASFIIDADIENQDSNYDEKFWDRVGESIEQDCAVVLAKTKKTEFVVATAQIMEVLLDSSPVRLISENTIYQKKITQNYVLHCKMNQKITLRKFVSVISSRDHAPKSLEKKSRQLCVDAIGIGFQKIKTDHIKAWAEKWVLSDIVIEGDVSAQQGIRFNIFQLIQTYSGHDARLNIGPKGFTGEKYGGSTYWDTEAYCLPFYLNTAEEHIARNLLLYRYNHLDNAIENAEKLGFSNGAALFPMVTINGEECHNEWEITFEEIHRNGAIAYAIFNYTRHTGDEDYLRDFGLEVLIAISRFWSQRITFSGSRQKYVMLGVTGPNEYENNVNNNWYTNYLARWTLQYSLENVRKIKTTHPKQTADLFEKISFKFEHETKRWESIIEKLHLPESKELGVFLQQDGYLDKEQMMASELPESQRPINQHWSWDRILRSCFIKQADVLQGIYLFEQDFTEEQIRKNFDFYESRTVHESSLSPCIHVVLATQLGLADKAYNLYLRTSRLDIDDYNHEVHEGCHITSMAGTWLSIVEGFGGMRVINDMLHFNPVLPKQWSKLEFAVRFRGRIIKVTLNQHGIRVTSLDHLPFKYFVNGEELLTEA